MRSWSQARYPATLSRRFNGLRVVARSYPRDGISRVDPAHDGQRSHRRSCAPSPATAPDLDATGSGHIESCSESSQGGIGIGRNAKVWPFDPFRCPLTCGRLTAKKIDADCGHACRPFVTESATAYARTVGELYDARFERPRLHHHVPMLARFRSDSGVVAWAVSRKSRVH